MTATHPFAIKLERAVFDAQRLLEELRRRKAEGPQDGEAGDPPGSYRDNLGRLRFPTVIFDHRQLGALAAPGMERQAEVQAGEALQSFDRTVAHPNEDKRLKALMVKLAQEESICARLRAIRNRDAGREVQTPCPGVTAARDALQAYWDNRPVGPQRSNSGGGGGGGF